MEKQFNSQTLASEAGSLKAANATGYKVAHEAGQVIVQFYSGKYPLAAMIFDSDIHMNHDIGLLREDLPDLKEITEEQQPAAAVEEPVKGANVINGVTLPADFKPEETTEPVVIRDQRLAQDISQLKAAGITGYKLGVNDAPYPFPLSLLRGNSVAFHYDYLQTDDRANDLLAVLEELPNIQLVGAPDHIS